MNRSLLIFIAFLRRDFFIYLRQIKNYLINYTLMYPVLFSFSYGYIIPNTMFKSGSLPSLGIILTGSLAFIFLILPANLNLLLLLDLEGDRYIDYQNTILNPRLIVLEKIIFSTIFSFVLSIPFFIISKAILRENLDTNLLSVPKLLSIILLGCFTCSAYAICAICILKGPHRTGTWWRRVNNPMLMLGGSWVPWVAILKVSKILGYIVLINPMIYITEGVRGAMFGENIYIPFVYCVIALTIFSVIFTFSTFYFFKKRTDYVG